MSEISEGSQVKTQENQLHDKQVNSNDLAGALEFYIDTLPSQFLRNPDIQQYILNSAHQQYPIL